MRLRNAIAVLSAAFACAAQAATTYRLTDIAQAYYWQPPAINNTGVVAGTATTPEGRQAFVYANGKLKLLDGPDGKTTDGFGINALGEVAGACYLVGKDITQACGWRTNGTVVGALSLGSTSVANAVNRRHVAVGYWVDLALRTHPFRFAQGKTTQLGDLGGNDSEATAINEQGLIAGYSTIALNGPFHAWLHDGTTMHDLGTLPGKGNSSFALALNDVGDVVGSSDIGWDRHAVIFRAGAIIDLGTLGGPSSEALGVNNRGDVVGHADSPTQVWNAFLYQGGQMLQLQDWLDPVSGAGWNLRWASGINDAGQIVGIGDFGGQYRIFLLTPMP